MKHIFLYLSVISAMAALGAAEAVHPPIPVIFNLDKPGNVTIAIDNAKGNRVRNLINDEFFTAGKHTVWWDGMDDHGRCNIRVHGGYDITGQLVEPGDYTVRGITHDPVDIIYEFTPYMPNNPPRTPDRRGQWMSDHTPPCSVLYVPAKVPYMMMGSSFAEGAHGLIWTDMNGKKIIGITAFGTHYMGPVKLCLPKGKTSLPFEAYGVGCNKDIAIINGFYPEKGKNIALVQIDLKKRTDQKGNLIFRSDSAECSLAVYDNTGVVSVPFENKLVFADLGNARKKMGGKILSTMNMERPRGLEYTADGTLYIISGNKLVKLAKGSQKTEDVIAGLDEPMELALSGSKIYISCRGKSHNVKVFDINNGKKLFEIGKPGIPARGPYDELRMNNPNGVTVDGKGRLWVAEEDFHPKRMSVWDAENGKFLQAFYGPTQYGGGGRLDPNDRSKFYYAGMEFKLDWKKGTDKIVHVYGRRDTADPSFPDQARNPGDYPVYLNGHKYFTNTYNADPVHGPSVETVWLVDKNGNARPCAMIGQINLWCAMTDGPLQSLVPENLSKSRKYFNQFTRKCWWDKKKVLGVFAWSDLNNDGMVQPEELTFGPCKTIGFNQEKNNLNFIAGDGTYFTPERFTDAGVPVYDAKKAVRRWQGTSIPYAQMIQSEDGKSIAASIYMEPVKAVNHETQRVAGVMSGITSDGKTWYYPVRWHGLHASQLYPSDREPEPGEIIGITKLVGPNIILGPDKIEVFTFYANSGIFYMMSIDGFYVTSLFKHGYFCRKFDNKDLKRGQNMKDYSSDGEGFYQTITLYPDGKLYVQALNHTSSILEVKGLNSLRRLPDQTITVTAKQLEEAEQYYKDKEQERQMQSGSKQMSVDLNAVAPVIDGKYEDWDDAEWVTVTDHITAALKIHDGKLFAAWHTNISKLMVNSGEEPMFKSGGAIDLMISSDPNRKGHAAVKGDQRLIVSMVGKKIKAQLYEPKSDKKGSPGSVSSPGRTIKFDYIGDVTDKVCFAQGKKKYFFKTGKTRSNFKLVENEGYFMELSIPLSELGLNVKPGMILKGDIGALTGDGTHTTGRFYWNNKGTSQLFDAPDESILTPNLWGGIKIAATDAPAAGKRNLKIFDTIDGAHLNVISSNPSKGLPAIGICWEGKGDLFKRGVGTKGFAIIRFDPPDWSHSDNRVVTIPPFSVSKELQPGGNDGFQLSCYGAYRYGMSIDGKERKGPWQGARLGGSYEQRHQTQWKIDVADDKPHRMTLLLPRSSATGFIEIEQNGVKEKLYEFTRWQYPRILQFDFTGSMTMRIIDKPYKRRTADYPGEKRDNSPALAAIFFD